MSNHDEFERLGLSLEERATNFETMLHIENVRQWLRWARHDLEKRELEHDQSKLRPPEVKDFVTYTKRLKGMTFGSDEYKQCLEEMRDTLDHHYKHNSSHHPQGNPEGIEGMDLLDMVEMLCDWQAACLRHADGDLTKSIAINAERFGMSPQLVRLFGNTALRMNRHHIHESRRKLVESALSLGWYRDPSQDEGEYEAYRNSKAPDTAVWIGCRFIEKSSQALAANFVQDLASALDLLRV